MLFALTNDIVVESSQIDNSCSALCCHAVMVSPTSFAMGLFASKLLNFTRSPE
jgi:hypothetical protein